MNTSTKYLLSFTAIIILAVVGFKFKQFYIDQDFTMVTEVPCDTTTGSCFTKECDVETMIVNCDGSPYKKVYILAANAPACFLEENCTSFECPLDDETCSIEYCSEDVIGEGEECLPMEENVTEQTVEEGILEEGQEEAQLETEDTSTTSTVE